MDTGYWCDVKSQEQYYKGDSKSGSRFTQSFTNYKVFVNTLNIFRVYPFVRACIYTFCTDVQTHLFLFWLKTVFCQRHDEFDFLKFIIIIFSIYFIFVLKECLSNFIFSAPSFMNTFHFITLHSRFLLLPAIKTFYFYFFIVFQIL